MTSRRARKGKRSTLALAGVLAAVGLLGCGSEWPEVPQEEGSAGGPPTIVAAEVLDSGVKVTYRVPGANGSGWPVLSITVQDPDSLLPPRSQDVRSVEEEGTVMVPIEVQPGSSLTVFGSAFYEDGERVHLPEKQFGSPETEAADGGERGPTQTTEDSLVGSWEATGEVIYVPPTVISNQPVGTVRKRPWDFEEVCQETCEIVFTRGTLYGPSVTKLVKRGRFFIAKFPPVRVPCAYPRGSSGPRASSGQSHSRYKLRWSHESAQLHAVEHRFQTGCYGTKDPPDVTRWSATRAP